MSRTTSAAPAGSPTAAVQDRTRTAPTAHGPYERHGPPRATPVEGGRPPRAPVHATVEATADKVLRSFNTWSFKREQPENPHLLLQVVTTAVAHAEPLRFVLYWGKGPRCAAAGEDVECLDFIGSMVARVRQAHSAGAAVTLILTDTHARHNGHAEESIDTYFEAITAEATRRGFQTCRLSTLVAAAPEAHAVDAAAPVPDEVLESLAASAGKWYRGEGSALDGARAYYAMNMVEKRAVEIAFPGAVFVTFNGSKLRCLFPARMPIFYMYSLRRGFAVKPWFLPADQELCSPHACRCRGGETMPD